MSLSLVISPVSAEADRMILAGLAAESTRHNTYVEARP
jgi:hypothetical protein